MAGPTPSSGGRCWAVDGGRRGEDDTTYTLVARCEENVERALDVDGTSGKGVLDGPGNGWERADVEDQVGPADRGVRALVGAEVALDETDVEFRQALAPPRGEVVQDAD